MKALTAPEKTDIMNNEAGGDEHGLSVDAQAALRGGIFSG